MHFQEFVEFIRGPCFSDFVSQGWITSMMPAIANKVNKVGHVINEPTTNK